MGDQFRWPRQVNLAPFIVTLTFSTILGSGGQWSREPSKPLRVDGGLSEIGSRTAALLGNTVIRGGWEARPASLDDFVGAGE